MKSKPHHTDYKEILLMMDRYLKYTQEMNCPSETEVEGLKIIVLENVFSPAFFDDSRFFSKELKKIVKPNESFLEIGTGTGATAIVMARHGCKVTASDINSSAIKNASINADLNSVDIEIVKSDIFDNLDSGKKFDVIFWSIPFGLVEKERTLDQLQRAIFGPDYNLCRRYINEGRTHLLPGGNLMIGFSKFFGDINKFQKIVKEAGHVAVEIASGKDRYGLDLTLYELIYATPNS